MGIPWNPYISWLNPPCNPNVSWRHAPHRLPEGSQHHRCDLLDGSVLRSCTSLGEKDMEKTWQNHGKVMKSHVKKIPSEKKSVESCEIEWIVQQNERTIFSLRLLPTVGIYKTKSQPDPSDSTSIKSSSRACAWFSMCRCGRTNKAYDYGSVTVTSNSWYPESQLALALTSTHLWNIYYFDGWIPIPY